MHLSRAQECMTLEDWKGAAEQPEDELSTDRLGELRSWVEWFAATYVLDPRAVPACWFLHESIAELLDALRAYHGYCHDRLASPTGPVDWHRVFRDLEPRLREWVSRTGCTPGAHRPDPVRHVDVDELAWERHTNSGAW